MLRKHAHNREIGTICGQRKLFSALQPANRSIVSFFITLLLCSRPGDVIPMEFSAKKTEWKGHRAFCLQCHNISAISLAGMRDTYIFNTVNTPLLIFSLLHHVIIAANMNFELAFSFHKNEIIGRHPSEFDFFENPNDLKEAIKMFEANNCIREFETVLIDRNGNAMLFEVAADLISVRDMDYVLITANRNTQIKQTELRLIHQLNQQRLIAEISQQLSSIDFYNKLPSILALMGKHTGVSRVYIFEDADDGASTSNTFEWCNSGIEPQIDNLKNIPYELIYSWKKLLIENGRIFAKNINELPEEIYLMLEPQRIKSILIFPLYADGNFIGFIGFDECTRHKEWRRDELDLLYLISNIVSNAFERRIMTGKISDKQTMLDLAIGDANQGIWEWDIKTNKIQFDKKWSGMLGYLDSDLKIDFSIWTNLLHPDDKTEVLRLIDDHLSGKTEFVECTYRLQTKNGDWRWVFNKGKLITLDENNKPSRVIGKHIDITEIKKTEEKLKAGLIKAKEFNEMKSRFVSNASHEFRTPLASIQLMSDVLKQYWSRLDQLQIDTRIVKISEQAAHLSKIVDKVFEISKFHQGDYMLQPVETDFVKLCRGICENKIESEYEPNRVLFDTNMESMLMSIDPMLISQAVENIISNALRFSDENTSVHVKLSENNKEIQIQIKDYGIGIGTDDLKHVFEPFFRGSNADGIDGDGLGLSFADESVRMHGGVIKIISKPEKGTTAIICLPKRNIQN